MGYRNNMREGLKTKKAYGINLAPPLKLIPYA